MLQLWANINRLIDCNRMCKRRRSPSSDTMFAGFPLAAPPHFPATGRADAARGSAFHARSTLTHMSHAFVRTFWIRFRLSIVYRPLQHQRHLTPMLTLEIKYNAGALIIAQSNQQCSLPLSPRRARFYAPLIYRPSSVAVDAVILINTCEHTFPPLSNSFRGTHRAPLSGLAPAALCRRRCSDSRNQQITLETNCTQ